VISHDKIKSKKNERTIKILRKIFLQKTATKVYSNTISLDTWCLNVKQGSCEYQLFEYFGLTRRENRTKEYNNETNKLTTLSTRQYTTNLHTFSKSFQK